MPSCSASPFVTVNGHPFFLFNVIDRKLILFGTVFGPHDFYLVALAVITLIVFIILFTVRLRPAVLRMDLSANGVHGDGLPEDRLLD